MAAMNSRRSGPVEGWLTTQAVKRNPAKAFKVAFLCGAGFVSYQLPDRVSRAAVPVRAKTFSPDGASEPFHELCND
jgi:hypothetical protein